MRSLGKKSENVGTWLTEEECAVLKQECRLREMTVSALLRLAILAYLRGLQ